MLGIKVNETGLLTESSIHERPFVASDSHALVRRRSLLESLDDQGRAQSWLSNGCVSRKEEYSRSLPSIALHDLLDAHLRVSG